MLKYAVKNRQKWVRLRCFLIDIHPVR